ncbi:hypothetical protein RM704_04160 [Streptomyces sp. DSM 3412]|uniref:Lipoprotein n=1 Tax=Streptomyces gottesmaniae TaxID=3075518 RepID=A0ABU2YTG5_9ACTN|nr:hypothetical protein [Streptomyces sp. DSM 3412]MDT0566684.1 hypothetical protein [Streptomyces sp. DSM 3412]
MSPSRPARAAVGVFVAVASVLLLGGCGDSGGLVSAGATPTASGPTRLWPGEPPASSPAYDYGEAETEVVRGIKAPGEDIHEVDPLAVVRAEIAAHPDVYSGSEALYGETAARMADCGKGRSNDTDGTDGTGSREGADGREGADSRDVTAGTGAARAACPVLKAYYRDLTGDGRDDMVLGFRLLPGNQTAVRMYTFQADRLVQVLANDDAVLAVELAGRTVIIRSPAGIVGYEYRTQWTWDEDQLAMLLTRDEILRVGASAKPSRSPAASPSASPSSVAPSASPSSVAPSASPSSVAPSASPSSVAPSASPSSVAPSASPSSVAPSASSSVRPG